MSTLATAQGVLRRLVDAVPVAWHEDRVFRYAAIGAGITLAVLVIRPGASRQDIRLPPLESSTAGMPAVLSLVGRSTVLPAQTPPAEVPKIVPGHSLGDVTVGPTPDNDRFGTFKPGKHP